MNQSNIRMGWLPNAQMIADSMPDAPKAKPPALLRRPATEFVGECADARDMVHPAAKAVNAPVTQTITIEVNAGASAYREAIEAAAESCAAQEPSPAKPEWIEWSGGECPVAGAGKYELRLRSGSVYEDRCCYADGLRWDSRGWWSDIVAYRVLP